MDFNFTRAQIDEINDAIAQNVANFHFSPNEAENVIKQMGQCREANMPKTGATGTFNGANFLANLESFASWLITTASADVPAILAILAAFGVNFTPKPAGDTGTERAPTSRIR